jgi:hypothetical protein
MCSKKNSKIPCKIRSSKVSVDKPRRVDFDGSKIGLLKARLAQVALRKVTSHKYTLIKISTLEVASRKIRVSEESWPRLAPQFFRGGLEINVR